MAERYVSAAQATHLTPPSSLHTNVVNRERPWVRCPPGLNFCRAPSERGLFFAPRADTHPPDRKMKRKAEKNNEAQGQCAYEATEHGGHPSVWRARGSREWLRWRRRRRRQRGACTPARRSWDRRPRPWGEAYQQRAPAAQSAALPHPVNPASAAAQEASDDTQTVSQDRRDVAPLQSRRKGLRFRKCRGLLFGSASRRGSSGHADHCGRPERHRRSDHRCDRTRRARVRDCEPSERRTSPVPRRPRVQPPSICWVT